MLMNSKDIFYRLMDTSNIPSLKKLSNKYGYTDYWATTTKHREGIPFELCVKIALEYKVSVDYLLFGIDKTPNKIDINELKLSVAEGLFTLIQLNMIKPEKDVKISVLADAITSEITKNDLIETSNEIKKAL